MITVEVEQAKDLWVPIARHNTQEEADAYVDELIQIAYPWARYRTVKDGPKCEPAPEPKERNDRRQSSTRRQRV